MVDSGTFHPQTVIDLDRHRRSPAEATHHPAEAGGEASRDLLSLPFLEARLSFPGDQVKMWAAYHLVDRWQGQCEQFIDQLWNQPHEEIRESAINLIGKYSIEHFAFPILRLFHSNDRTLSPLAGVALGRLQYEPAARSLHRWFLDTLSNPETNPLEVEAAAESLLFYDHRAYWDEVYAQIETLHQNHNFYSLLVGLLSVHASTPRQVERLAQSYGAARRIFHDFHLTQHLVEMVGRGHIARYLQARLNGGYPLTAIYQECLKVLGVEPPDERTHTLLNSLSECRNTQAGIQRFLHLADELLDHFFPGGEGAEHTRAMLNGCRTWIGSWDDAILKVREVEYHFIVSLPLAILLQQVEARCLANPEAEALRITCIYQSPLLSPRFMGQVLNLIARRAAHGGVAELGTPYTGWVRDDEKDALWKLFTNQLEGVDYPFEQVLPQPWIYPVPTLMERLVAILQSRLEGYLISGREQAVDYCLEVFQRSGSTAQVPLLVRHFDTLINHHYHAFVELMTHLPDKRFLPLLVAHYREGEPDLLQLIHFICDVHQQPYPHIAQEESPSRGQGPAMVSVRLLCPGCGGSYQYNLETLYVNEECIEQRQIPAPQDLWTNSRFRCKKCDTSLPFEPDERFLNDLFTELLAARLVRPGDPEEAALRHIRLIQFPVLEGRTRNPEVFLAEVEQALAKQPPPPDETTLLLELGRFRLELGQVAESKGVFQKLLAGPNKCPWALYYLGVIAFQEKNLFDARVHFSRLIQSCSREDFDNELDNPVDMAHHYLKLLDKREFKRSHFHLISS